MICLFDTRVHDLAAAVALFVSVKEGVNCYMNRGACGGCCIYSVEHIL